MNMDACNYVHETPVVFGCPNPNGSGTMTSSNPFQDCPVEFVRSCDGTILPSRIIKTNRKRITKQTIFGHKISVSPPGGIKFDLDV